MTHSAKRLWDKGVTLDEAVHRFTVGDDPAWDRYLVHGDCVGSAAHARTLHRTNLLSDDELTALLTALREIDQSAAKCQARVFPEPQASACAAFPSATIGLDSKEPFAIPPELEDVHTAIEARLCERCGDAGRRIHTGRSRNDQVACAIRLFMRRGVLGWCDALAAFAESALRRIREDGSTPMPGYTHGQPAMPSSVGQWLHAFVEAALEQYRAALDLFDRLDSCPLGTGAGFGVSLPLDRAYTAELLGFSRAQRSPIDVQNSRGRLETYFARVAADVGAIIERLGADVALFCMAEFGFFRLPESMTTGSSIMPQKRNPDVAELLRARGARLRARVHELECVRGKLPSGYHRDLQLTKEPAIRAALDVQECLPIATRVVEGLIFDRERLSAAMRPELYATEAAYALVQQGVPFREAYQRVAADLAAGRVEALAKLRSESTAGRVPPEVVDAVAAELAGLVAISSALIARIEEVERQVLGE
jgi:argininosuccinate lyase